MKRKIKNTILKITGATAFAGIFIFGSLLNSIGLIYRVSVFGFGICLTYSLIFAAVNHEYLDNIL